jgi:hypothetical protein
MLNNLRTGAVEGATNQCKETRLSMTRSILINMYLSLSFLFLCCV